MSTPSALGNSQFFRNILVIHRLFSIELLNNQSRYKCNAGTQMSCLGIILCHMPHQSSLYIALLNAIHWPMVLLGLLFRLNSYLIVTNKCYLCAYVHEYIQEVWHLRFVILFSSILLFTSLTLANCREVLWLLLTLREHKFI